MSAAEAVLAQLRQSGVIVTRLTTDSRRVEKGDVFLALPGAHVDGHAYIEEARNRGAAAVLVDGPLSGEGTVGSAGGVTISVQDLVGLAGEIAHRVYGQPSDRLWLAGVTGTNGKTSVTQWIAQALTLLGHKCAVIGTLGNGFLPTLESSPNTTPDALIVHAALARYLEQGAGACAMEVSSIGLHQSRVSGVAFDVAIFTNLTRDHLDYHGTMEAYAAAKERFFAQPGLRAAVINLDDKFGLELADRLRKKASLARVVGYSLNGVTDGGEVIQAEALQMTTSGVAFSVQGVRFRAAVVGRFNVSNLLAVISALLLRGDTLEAIAGAVEKLLPPPGRMEIVRTLSPVQPEIQPLVVVDYAHTPDALEKALSVLREAAVARGGKLICVFGCGGERDAGKRPQMGAIAEKLADRVLVTADNPRGEDERKIFSDILSGMRQGTTVVADRAMAIGQAVAEADSRDVVLLAGKGHESYQEIAGVRHPFADLHVARAALARRFP